MNITRGQYRLLQLCATGAGWSLIARQAQDPGGLDLLWQGVAAEKSAAATRSVPLLRQGLADLPALAARVDGELAAADRAGARLVTVLDDDYPVNLRMVRNLPPFLFCRGELREDDARAVAVVGTRRASEMGVSRAARMSRLLAQRQVTVVSGLARGIDTAAHRAALDAGGRTIAVLGTGINRCYPAENRDLAEQITANGALVSQFWPSQAPGRDTFPRRNVVSSGISQGTVVIEASSVSGAKMQARIATEHGKKVFLVRSLVASEAWAREYVDRRGAIEVADVDAVTARLAEPRSLRRPAAKVELKSDLPALPVGWGDARRG